MDNKKQDIETTTGTVIEAMPNVLFKVLREDTNEEILAYLAGKMRIHRIKILPGDKVLVETTPYDDKKGRIVYRLK